MNTWTKRIWRCFSPMVVYLIVSIGISFLSLMICSIEVSSGYSQSEKMEITKDPVRYEQFMDQVNKLFSLNTLLITSVAFMVMIPFLLWMHIKDRKKLRMPETNMSLYSWAVLPVLGVAACLFLNGLVEVTNLGKLLGSSYEATATAIYSSDIRLQILGVGICAPIAEELIFRGLIYKRMRTFLTAPIAIMLSAVLFGIYHGNALQFLYAMMLGFLLAYVFELYRSVIASIIIHGSANLLSVILMDNEKLNQFLAKDLDRFRITTIVCGIITCLCILILIYLNKKGEKKENE